MPSEKREEYLRTCRPKATTPNSLTRIADIRRRIERAAVEGYSVTDAELELGMRTLAVPVTDASGRVQAAMSTAAFSGRVGLEEMLATYLPGLREQATALGRML
jgi:IclR family transcriptional regulator, pca regulon regulatory protein